MPTRRSDASCGPPWPGAATRSSRWTTASRPCEALAKHSFDLVIISLDLPGLGTADTLRLFRFSVARQDWPAFIGLAQQPSLTHIRDFSSFGVAVVLPSPVRPQTLLSAVADLIQGHRDEPGTTPTQAPTGSRTPSEVACLDERALREVERLGADPSFLPGLIEEFLRGVQTNIEFARGALGTEQGYFALIDFGQTLQDNAGSLGAMQLYQLGLIAARLPEPLFEREAEPLLERIEVACQRTRSAFWQYLRWRALSRSPG